MVIMKLCPNCKSIQKAGTICPLCNCPVEDSSDQVPAPEEEQKSAEQQGKAA